VGGFSFIGEGKSAAEADMFEPEESADFPVGAAESISSDIAVIAASAA